MKLPASLQIEDVATAFARAVPFFSVVIGTILLVMNMWVAARAVQVSGRLERTFPALPESLHLPRHVLVIFGLALLGLLLALMIPSLSLGVASGMVAAGLITLFSLQGLAFLHSVTRNIPFRAVLLTMIYLGIMFLSLWPLLIAAVAGFADCLVSFRRASPVAENSEPKGE